LGLALSLDDAYALAALRLFLAEIVGIILTFGEKVNWRPLLVRFLSCHVREDAPDKPINPQM